MFECKKFLFSVISFFVGLPNILNLYNLMFFYNLCSTKTVCKIAVLIDNGTIKTFTLKHEKICMITRVVVNLYKNYLNTAQFNIK